MPFWFRIDRSRRLLLAYADGELTVPEIQSVLQVALEHPGFEAGLRQLCDLRKLRELRGSFKELLRLAEYGRKFAERLQGGRLALVAERDSVYGMLRMYQAVMDDAPLEIRVFREMHEATSWLEV